MPLGGLSNPRRIWSLSKFDENVFRNLLLALKVWCPSNGRPVVILELEKVMVGVLDPRGVQVLSKFDENLI